MHHSKPTVSIVVSTRNRVRLLERLLKALETQSAPRESYEIIVIDDASSDETPRLLESYRARGEIEGVSSARHLGIPAARQIGIEMSRGEYIIFTEDDCIPCRDWIQRMVERLGEYALVMGCVSLRERSRYWLTCFNIANFHPFLKGRHERLVKFVSFNNFGFRRNIADHVGAIDVTCSEASDTEFGLRAQRKGHTILYAPEAVVVHDPDNISGRHAVRYAAHHASMTIGIRYNYRDILRSAFVTRSAPLLVICAPIIALKTTIGIYAANRRLIPQLWTFPAVFLLKLAWCWGASRGLKRLMPQATHVSPHLTLTSHKRQKVQ
jgi:glycosyltransferase involved in cell wall biosynthesis